MVVSIRSGSGSLVFVSLAEEFDHQRERGWLDKEKTEGYWACEFGTLLVGERGGWNGTDGPLLSILPMRPVWIGIAERRMRLTEGLISRTSNPCACFSLGFCYPPLSDAYACFSYLYVRL